MESQSNSLGSLSQSSRLKELNVAKWILIVVGLLSLALNGYFVFQAEAMVDDAIQVELAKPENAGATFDPEVRDNLVKLQKVVGGIMMAVSVAFIVCGVFVKKYPVPMTVTGLVLYLGAIAAGGMLDPTTLWRGILIKIIIIVCLVKGVQSAVAYQREVREGQAGA